MTCANVKEKNTKAYHKCNILHKHHRLLHLFALWNLFSGAPLFTIILILQVSKVKLIQNDLSPDQVPRNSTSLKLSITAFVGCHLTIPSSECLWIQIQTAFFSNPLAAIRQTTCQEKIRDETYSNIRQNMKIWCSVRLKK